MAFQSAAPPFSNGKSAGSRVLAARAIGLPTDGLVASFDRPIYCDRPIPTRPNATACAAPEFGLVHHELAMSTVESVQAGGRAIEVRRIPIVDKGREAPSECAKAPRIRQKGNIA